MTYEQIKELVVFCNVLGIHTLGQLRDFKERYGCENNTALLTALQNAIGDKQ